MKIADARAFAKALLRAADAAEDAGQDDVSLVPFMADDDAARAELQAAIDAAKAGGQ